MIMARETTRRLIHFAFGMCAFLLGVLGRTGGIAMASAAVLYNAVLAPRLGWDAGYRREGERRFGGLVSYAVAVLLLVALCPATVAAGAWLVLAVGDPVAAAVGSRRPRPRVPWNPAKSLVGSLAGALAGSAACFGALRFYETEAGWQPALWAGCAGALAESLPLPLDDNLLVAGAAALALWPFLA